MRIAVIPDLEKPNAVAAAGLLAETLAQRAQATILERPDLEALRRADPQLVVVLGGDGSILSTAHMVCQLGVPVAGVNFGKLGYLAAFSLSEFQSHLDSILAGQAPITERLMLEGGIYQNGAGGIGTQTAAGPAGGTPLHQHVALNDVVINSGEPFRMIELHVRIDEEETTTFRSDGVIVATSSGSTGYNLSAGGPLITPDVKAMVLTPICPHSLSFRPVVVSDTATIVIHPHRVNPGTRVSFDGQRLHPLEEDQCVIIRRGPNVLKLVENPMMSRWRMLATKLHWAQNPWQQ